MAKNETEGRKKTQVSEEEKKLKEDQKLEGKQKKEEYKPEEEMSKPAEENFPVVGIGASAGGLGAFEAFFSGIPEKISSRVAFVIVQHLDPKHKSILTSLIGRYTNLPVYEIEEGMSVKPNCVYVIPPNNDLIYRDGVLHLLELTEPHGLRMPINSFFRSLAEEKRERAIGIVLSGTGSDGTLGIQAIKAEGGMTIAQSPESSEYDSMPRSVINAGLADYILPPKEMYAQLTTYIAQNFEKEKYPASNNEDFLKKIFRLILNKTGHNFSSYKRGTICRRIGRRMAINNIKSLSEYSRYLEKKPEEIETLFRDFIINVTSFFRNPDSFNSLKEVIPNIFASEYAGEVIRIWVPGCSSGEEAYSIAILFKEYIEAMKRPFKVQIFATDIDKQEIEHARTGIYPADIAVDVSAERLRRFFNLGPDGNYRVQKFIRDMIIFSEHDLVKDPPFSNLDLISCRNLLIYMDGELQKRLISLFHYALKPGGYLLLGTVETINESMNLFEIVDRKSKLYQSKKDVEYGRLRSMMTFISPQMEFRMAQRLSDNVHVDEDEEKLRSMIEQKLLQLYAPAGAIINEKGDILYLYGRTGKFLEPAPGKTNNNILKMAREGLLQKLTASLHRVIMYKEPLFYPGLQVKTNGDFTTINLVLIPLDEDINVAGRENLILVVFEVPQHPEQKQIGKEVAIDTKETAAYETKMDVDVNKHISALERELKLKEEELRTSNEELVTSTEEMQSINEELQSTNEELETSKEELQSINEELITVNTELQNKVNDLSRLNDDMNNLMASTGIGTIFVDNELNIMRYTPEVKKIINLIQTDIGRPIGDITPNLIGYDSLKKDLQEVMENLATKSIEVQVRDDGWYLLRIRPYCTAEKIIKGAVITFTEITELKQARELLKESEFSNILAAVVNDSNDAIILQDLDGNIKAWNSKAEAIYGWSKDEALQMNVSNMIPENSKKEECNVLKKLSRAQSLKPYNTKRIGKDGRTICVQLTASSLVDENGDVYAIATTERELEKYPKEEES
jgi:two-component system CheB/CheR fusion protein